MLHLSDSTLGLVARRMDVPLYDRSLLSRSIVHLGVGGFHRAHQAVYLDDLARAGMTDWGVVGVGLRSPALRDALVGQDNLFTVLERDSHGENARVVGSMCDYLFAGDDPGRVIGRLADPRTRIVTMTITGDAYNVDSDGIFRDDTREVLADLRRPHLPITWFGYLTEALAFRRRAGLGGFTVLSCDNLATSGDTTRTALVAFARLRDETLARWIEHNVSFPNSMVDRITPGTDDDVRQHLTRTFGVQDRSPVATEPFTQWVVEDAFAQGRPPLEDAGVQVVADVAPYKLIKTRLLNGTHTAMAYLGWLAGHRTTAEVAADPTMRAFLAEMMRTEIAPLLPSVADMEVDAYIESVLRRLSNETICDPLSRLCRRGSTKVPAYLLPSLVEARQQGQQAPLLTLALAGWFRYLRGKDLDGRAIDIQDANLDDLQDRALRGGPDPALLLDVPGVTDGLRSDVGLSWDVRRAIRDLEHGVESAVQKRLARTPAPILAPLTSRSMSSEPHADLIS
ncbi:MAG: Mannitol dehydrogenase domain protein [Nocardioides sp.]|jgi:mannitol 2-dehydrogenase|uniref:mannitol dehydrogenase family protein n=1 Tax=Nocardioides sp. TaxID=35761 RepID=UPI002627529C|nr:mannitol dehydrogenase family protein [Nocardioides sp.]MCW2835587.1 Mannitol dehydrogenase domain protein [Nocardioides sp.]